MKRLMKFGVFSVIGLAMVGGCDGFVPLLFDAEEPFSISEPADDIGTFKVDWQNGRVKVEVDPDATEIAITGEKVVRASSQAAAEAALDDIEIGLSISDSSPSVATLEMNSPDEFGFVFEADVTVVLPVSMILDVENINGTIEVDGNEAATSVDSENGTVSVRGQDGDLTVLVNNGAVEATTLGGDVNISIENGRVKLDATLADGEEAEVTTENGDVDIESTGGSVDVDVENGDVELLATPENGGDVRVDVSRGHVDLRVAEEFAASLFLQTDFGAVSPDLDKFDVDDLEQSLVEVRATLNGGGGSVEVRTDVGNIDFDSRS